jgi:hypothetical protein
MGGPMGPYAFINKMCLGPWAHVDLFTQGTWAHGCAHGALWIYEQNVSPQWANGPAPGAIAF